MLIFSMIFTGICNVDDDNVGTNDVRHYTGVFRARRSEARIQQMLWKANYSDIVFLNAVCMSAYTFVAGMFTRCSLAT